MQSTLQHRVVAISGGNGGIGLAIAQGVALAGGVPVIWGRNEKKTDQAIEWLRADGAEAYGVPFDQSEQHAARQALQRTLDLAGHLDSLIANAGVAGQAKKVTDVDFDSWVQVIDTNLNGTFRTLQEVSRYLIDRQQGGALVAVTSVAVQFGAPREAHYAAAKAAITSLVRSFAVQLGPDRIRVNALAHGWIDTEFIGSGSAFAGESSHKLKAVTEARTPVGRWGTPADVVPIALYLANPEPHFHTGDVITVDGAYSIA